MVFCYCRYSSSAKEIRTRQKLMCLCSVSAMHYYLTGNGKIGSLSEKVLKKKRQPMKYHERKEVLKWYTAIENTERFIDTAQFCLP